MMANKNNLKFWSGLAVFGYISAMAVMLIIGLSGKRIIGIEQHKQGGVVHVKQNKIVVQGITLHADLIVKTTGIVDYMLLTDKDKGNFLSCIVKLIMWIYALVLIWKIDLSDPFDHGSFKMVSSIATLYIMAFMADLIGVVYTGSWFQDLYHASADDFQYAKISYGFLSFNIPVLIAIMVVVFYRIATYNQQEQDLTI